MARAPIRRRHRPSTPVWQLWAGIGKDDRGSCCGDKADDHLATLKHGVVVSVRCLCGHCQTWQDNRFGPQPTTPGV